MLAIESSGQLFSYFIARALLELWERLDLRFHGIILSGTFSTLPKNKEAARGSRGVKGQGLNPGKDIDVCKCILPSRHVGAIKSLRAASPLVRLVKGKERWGTPPGVLPQNWGVNEPNRTVTCMVLRATDNDRRHLALCYDEFRGPQSGLCRSGVISNNIVI
ncbi:uncharacterized protein TNCV_1814791 [Trichonephila clavipes]|nr:uncharacterized protein TNCV_1814791 [Trichonephila clavipes]